MRLWVDLLHTNFAFARRYAANRLYLGLALGLSSLGVFATWFFSVFEVGVLDFFFISATLGGFAMAVYVPMILYVNLTVLPEGARPKAINIAMVGLAALVYNGFALYTLWSKIGSWFE